MQDSLRRKDSAAVTTIGVVTLILALCAAILILVAPAVTELLLSFKKYNVAQGILSSPWVGLGNFEMLLQNPHFAQSLLWTLLHPAFSAFFLFLMSLVAGYVLLAVGKARWLRHAVCTLLLIPLIVPTEIWVRLFADMRLYALEREAGILSGLVIAFWCSIKYLGLAALLVTAAMSHGRRKPSVPLLAAGASALAVLGLMGRFDAGFIRLMPPMLYPVTGLDPLAYRSGLVGMQLGVGASVNVIMLVLKVAAQAIVALPILLLVKGLFPAGCKTDDSTLRNRLASLTIPGIVLIAAVVLAIGAFSRGGGNLTRAFASYPVYIVLAFMGTAFNTALCFLLARPAACSGKAGRIVMTATLALLTALGLTAVPLGEYLLFRSVGLVNTWFAVLFSGIGAVWGVWPLLFAARGQGVNTSTEWFTRMWKPALGLWAVQAMLQMNNTFPSHFYMTMRIHPLLLAAQEMAVTQGGSTLNLMLLAAAVLIVPLVILLIIRTILNEKESLGLFLPGK